MSTDAQHLTRARFAEMERRLAAVTAQRDEFLGALEGLVDDEECWFDHHGYCQAHFITSPCEMQIARAAIAKVQS